MSDFNSGLPIRSEADGTDARVQVKIVDGLTPSQMAEVDTDKNLHVEMHGNDAGGTDRVLKVSESGNAALDGVYNVSNNSNPSSVGLVASVRNATPGAAQQTIKVTGVNGSTSTTVWALDVALRDENAEPFTVSNPLPVAFVDSEGTEVNDYLTSAAVASGSSVNHDYTVTALKTLKLSRVFASASGKMKIEIQVESGVASGVFASKFVGFNSTANPNIDVNISENITVAAGVRVRVIRTNKDNQAQDLYSTISGHEI